MQPKAGRQTSCNHARVPIRAARRPAARGRQGPGFGWMGAALLTLMAAASPVVAQSPPADAASQEDPAPVTMETLLEVTIFQVDAVHVTIEIGGAAAARLRELARVGSGPETVADSIARVSVRATDARVTLVFQRDAGMDRFLDEVRQSTRAALDAGFITADTYDMVAGSLSNWYAFLEDRGVREDDQMLYRIDGDTLNIRYRSADGELLLDQTDMGEQRRAAVLGGYFAPGSDFREGLVESLLRSEGNGAR